MRRRPFKKCLLPLFRKIRGRPARGISSPRAQIHETAQIGADCHIAASVVIGEDAVIGRRVAICNPGVVVGAGCRIGDQTILRLPPTRPYITMLSLVVA